MSGLQRVISYAGLVVMLATLVGVVARKHYRASAAFTAYLTIVFATDLLIGIWPGSFYTRDFWVAKEIVVTALRFAVALELAYRTFTGFPGAAATLRRTLLLALLATYAAVLAVPAEDPTYPTIIAELQPRIANGTVWILTAISGLILWYRLPLTSFHKAILIGLAPFLIVSTMARNLLATNAELRTMAGYLETGAYCLMLLYWFRAAWQPAEEPARAEAPGPRDPALRPSPSRT